MSPTSTLRLFGPSTLPAKPRQGALELHIQASMQALMDRSRYPGLRSSRPTGLALATAFLAYPVAG
jgi:hypothetical protein